MRLFGSARNFFMGLRSDLAYCHSKTLTLFSLSLVFLMNSADLCCKGSDLGITSQMSRDIFSLKSENQYYFQFTISNTNQ